MTNRWIACPFARTPFYLAVLFHSIFTKSTTSPHLQSKSFPVPSLQLTLLPHLLTAMESLHRDTRRIILEARNQLEALEAASQNMSLDPTASSAVVTAFRDNVRLLSTHSSSLRALLTAEPPSRREVWKARLRDLDDQIAELGMGDARCAQRFRRIDAERRMRDELFNRREGKTYGGDSVLRMGLAEEHGRLDRSGNVMSGIMRTGRAAMGGLMEQGERMRGVKRKMLDVMNGIGVDRQIIASIERREWSDTVLVYALMIGLLLLLGVAVLWKYHRRRQWHGSGFVTGLTITEW